MIQGLWDQLLVYLLKIILELNTGFVMMITVFEAFESTNVES